ncbi:MAG: hypothetical protein J6M15_08230 [Prevotella sp.]|nr:hypothetical protein [Prevotella sp.]
MRKISIVCLLLLVSTYLFADSAERMSFAIRQLMSQDEAGRRAMAEVHDVLLTDR